MRAITTNFNRPAANDWFNDFDHLFKDVFSQNLRPVKSRWTYDVDETDNYILFTVDLPGVDEKDIHIETKEGVLSIEAERKREDKDGVHSVVGREYGRLQQFFSLPESIDKEKIEADYTDGVLKILMPKIEKAQPKKIELNSKRGHFFSQLLGSKKAES